MMVLAPSAAKAFAMPSPMPDVDPVTRAVFPLRRMGESFSVVNGLVEVAGFRLQPVRLHGEAVGPALGDAFGEQVRSEEHTSELQSLMRISYAVFCLKKKKHKTVHSNDMPPGASVQECDRYQYDICV